MASEGIEPHALFLHKSRYIMTNSAVLLCKYHILFQITWLFCLWPFKISLQFNLKRVTFGKRKYFIVWLWGYLHERWEGRPPAVGTAMRPVQTAGYEPLATKFSKFSHLCNYNGFMGCLIFNVVVLIWTIDWLSYLCLSCLECLNPQSLNVKYCNTYKYLWHL